MNSTTHYPTIAPVPAGVARPFWSVMIPTYNCAKYLRETLQSVLAQDPGADQMQIEVIDDCSTRDDPEAVVREVAGDRVSFFRQPTNGGVVNNFNTCIARARGHWVHILHGDDYLRPGFYATLKRAANDDVGLLCTRALIVDEAGGLEALSPRISAWESRSCDPAPMLYENRLYTPSVVVRRAAYEQLGGFTPRVAHTTDWEMWLRVATACGVVAINEPLACYRQFAGNDTSRLVRTGQNLREYFTVAQIFLERYPQFDITRQIRAIADAAFSRQLEFESKGDREAASSYAQIVDEMSRKLGWGFRCRLAARRLRLALRAGKCSER